MSKKTIIIIGVAILIIIGAIVAIMLAPASWFTKSSTLSNTNLPVNQNNQPAGQKNVTIDLPKLTPDEQLVTLTARNFSERFASYSTDSGKTNLTELKGLAVPSLLDQYLKQSPAKTTGFYGVSAKALNIKINSLDAAGGTAKVTVSLQVVETKAGEADFVSNRIMNLDLVRSGQNWLVNKLAWQ